MRTSTITATDMFCGAGGSSLGATEAGVNLRLAMNHWPVAIETHNTNFPRADHVCADVSQCDPRRYPSTTILIASPECTNHSIAKGARRMRHQMELLPNGQPDPAAERSRATMWDVPRFAEYHGYQLIIVENVVDAREWVLFDAWLLAMKSLGYDHRLVFTNSMHTLRVPQSRDRMYVVFWRTGNAAPDLDFHPLAPCADCGDVRAVQAWKRPDRKWGRYRAQYVFACPQCAQRVEPYALPAADALDWTLPTQLIRDRGKPLADKTRARIAAGISRYWPASVVAAAGNTYESGNYRRAYSTDAPLPVQVGTNQYGVAMDPLLVRLDHPGLGHVRPVGEPMETQTAHHTAALVQPPLIAELRGGGSTARPVTEPLATICASGNHHGLVMRNNTGGAEMCTPTEEPFRTLTTAGHQSLIEPPLLTGYYGNGRTQPVTLPMGTQSTRDRFGLVERGGSVEVEDCYFRMLDPKEIGAAMAFPADYIVTGTKRDRVKQYGNAVTPPVMAMLVERCMATLA